MPVDLYNLSLSAPCALVRMVAKHIGVELTVKEVNFFKKEHLSPEYLKINPFHKVPTISDDGFVIYESTAICLYLLNKYAPDSDLYPKDLQKRARVDQVLATVTSFVQPCYDEFYRNSAMLTKKPTAQQVQDLEETGLKGLEHLVGDGRFAVGDALTLADLTLVAHLSYSIMMPVFDRKKFSKLVSYYECVSAQMPHFAETKPVTEWQVQKWSALK
ncbi:glutathione S-transferase, putative [Ixodes scapularis]|uniref:Glutathione S-transferase, putative n=1 Tax=Ixodes scapularis TaxID=6945 RepID=B7Q278_IXOSC|nr:glutathione S-transferase, putative [Ixodes scapularis]|eukprot:XP_002410551.1 glutathione S-transferase, putative [Ixodes scapularis]